MKNKLIGLTGLARSGKDSFAEFLRHHGFIRSSFAYPVKQLAETLLDLPFGAVHTEAFKTETHPMLGMTGRTILQKLGTEAIRGTFGDDFWIKRWEWDYSYVGRATPVVVTDVRFENEAQAIRKLGGVIVHIRRPGGGLAGAEALHSSEQGVELGNQDVVIENDGTLEDLAVKAERLLAFIDEVAEARGLRND